MMNSLQEITIQYSFIPVLGVSGLYQVIMPFEHPDTDLVEVYAKITDDSNIIQLTDMGVTLMRLSYTVDITNNSTKKYLKSIIKDQSLTETAGEIAYFVNKNELEKEIGYFIQGLSKVLSIASLTRTVKESIFLDLLSDFIIAEAQKYKPIKNFVPIVKNDDYMVNYKFGFPDTKRPIFLFGVNNSNNAKEALSSILYFMNENISFKSTIVYEDIASMGAKDQRRLMDIADKQFSSIEGFKQNGIPYIERELGEVS